MVGETITVAEWMALPEDKRPKIIYNGATVDRVNFQGGPGGWCDMGGVGPNWYSRGLPVQTKLVIGDGLWGKDTSGKDNDIVFYTADGVEALRLESD